MRSRFGLKPSRLSCDRTDTKAEAIALSSIEPRAVKKPSLSCRTKGSVFQSTRAPFSRRLRLAANHAGRSDLDHRSFKHDAGRWHEGERRRLGRVREVLAPHPCEGAVVPPRLGEVQTHVVAVCPVGLVRL